MKATAEESATLKQALKKSPRTPALDAEAKEHVAEADESIEEVEEGYDYCTPDSWVAAQLAEGATTARQGREAAPVSDYSVTYDDRSDPSFPGWLLRWTDEHGQVHDEILRTTDPDDEAGARAEAERFLGLRGEGRPETSLATGVTPPKVWVWPRRWTVFVEQGGLGTKTEQVWAKSPADAIKEWNRLHPVDLDSRWESELHHNGGADLSYSVLNWATGERLTAQTDDIEDIPRDPETLRRRAEEKEYWDRLNARKATDPEASS